jgi:DNA-binding transcriptional ArsR family regulator
MAGLSAAVVVVVVEAAEDSGSLSTARAAGSRGVGHVLVLPGAPWDPGAAGCNQLIRDGATLVRSLTDILEELGATVTGGAASIPAWSGLEAPARAVLTALIDGQLLTPGRLATATDLPPATLDTALLDLELAGLVRRTAAGIQAVSLPPSRVADAAQPAPPPSTAPTVESGDMPAGNRGAGVRPVPPAEIGTGVGPAPRELGEGARPVPSSEPRGPPEANTCSEVLECGGSGGDDDGDD